MSSVCFLLGVVCIIISLSACGGPTIYSLVPGPQGPTGASGSNGHSALLSQVAADSSACSNGGTVLNAGTDLNDNGVLDASEITSVAVLCNGTNGTSPGLPQFMPVVAIQPCGASSSSYKEVLLGLYGGSILSEFTGGSATTTIRNTLLPDGSYFDTDSSQCNFSVSTASNGDRTVSWNGSSSNGSGPYHAGSATYTASTLTWSVTY